MSQHLRVQWRQAAGNLPLDWPHETLYHATNRAAAEAIISGGFLLPDRPQHGADYGKAIYFTPDKDWARGSYGTHLLAVTLRPDARILDLRYCWEAGIFDKSYEAMSKDEKREAATSRGYVGLTDGDVVALFDPTSVQDVRKA